MGVAADIPRAWRHPRLVMQRRLADGVREDRALAILMAACLLIFVAQWPRLIEGATVDPSTPLDIRIGGALFGWLFIAPLLLYLIAALSHLIARLAGGQGSWYAARIALFWSLLSVAPIWMLNGIIAALIGPGIALTLTSIFALAAFLAVWISSLIEAEYGGASK